MVKKMVEKKYDFCVIKAIIGLGNPGRRYENTRHNIGFRIVDAIAEQEGASWRERDAIMHTSVGSVYLVKPMNYMNNSGIVVPFLLKKGVKPEEVLVVHDDLEKAFGKISIRWNGSARGHNGLRSIDGMIGKEFWRLRFGIGRPEDKSQVSDYVLSRFTPEQESEVAELIERAIGIVKGEISI